MARGAHRDGFPDYADTSTPGRHLQGKESRNEAFQAGSQSASMGRAAEREWSSQTNTESAPNYIFGGRY